MICSSWPKTISAGNRSKRKCKSFINESTFICGIVKKPIGSNVPVAEKSRVLKRISKKDSALQRHLTWLRELQEKKRRIDEEKRLEELKLERKRLPRVNKRAGKKENGQNDEQLSNPQATEVEAAEVEHVSSAKTKQKPAWCQTEDASKTAEDHAEETDAMALLDFVDNLNFDQYNEDLELQTLMSQVKERIKSLQKEKKKDETRLQACVDSEKAALRAEALGDQSLFVDKVPPDLYELDVDDTCSISESVMSTDSTIKSIHSRKSLAALISKAKSQISSQLTPIGEDEHETALPQPILITHTDDDGARMAEKKSINKLAFKNRNPAI
eukprot:CCRYP_009587-RA/>CCRYP_009587-RA protein AED:0.08 eAED:0.08 QI:2055/1/1/1/0.66/0.75/4/453/327